MLFNSFNFLIFFPVVTTAYFLIPHKVRWFLLLAASCYFYMVFIPVYILILFTTIIVDYFAGILIEKTSGKRKKLYLIVSIVSNVGFLAFFKYANFIDKNLNFLAHCLHWNYSIPLLHILLPIGLSFHTFQAMAYTIEVYRGVQKPERNPGIFALYVMFYPQLVAGPIERPQNLIHQFYEEHKFDYERAVDGLKLILWGFSKKVLIADRLAVYVNAVYGNPSSHSGSQLAIATYFFAFQIYCDFSGYSDIAIGAARVMGFKLMKNFNRPYSARSIAEFWRRWHIALSSWFRDYVYIPLGGNRVTSRRLYFNIAVVFLISGLWHGAGWTYVIWGGLHGIYLIISLIGKKIKTHTADFIKHAFSPRLYSLLCVLITFHLVTFAWIFFRANNISDAVLIVKKITHGIWSASNIYAPLGMFWFIFSVCLIALMEMIQYEHERVNLKLWLSSRTIWLRWAVYYSVILFILIFGKFSSLQFIYFQF